ncbi:uncharacterized protein [Nerophis lumbriciformis]|uniref:uncharacterized protein n=1 Tax=Nerophis lumbriciformis TaxID=546530 RepID=UPI003BAB6342
MPPERGYEMAKYLLEKHFGDQYQITAAYMDKVFNWPLVKSEDVRALQAYSLYLRECCTAMENVQYMQELNMSAHMKTVISKLPYRLRESWRVSACNILENHHRRPQFSDIVAFIERQAQESEECREDERSIEAHTNEMSTEMLKVHPDLNSLKERRRRTYAYRKTFMATAKAEEIIEKFPALKLPKILLWEMKEQFLVEADRRMATELDRMATKMVQRASMCDLKDCCQRAINACLDDSVRRERTHPFYTLYWRGQACLLQQSCSITHTRGTLCRHKG